MSSKEKLFLKALQNPKNISYQELETLLKQFGFKKVKTNAGSHFKWRHTEKNITYFAPRRNPMKSIYVKQLTTILKSLTECG